MATETYTEYPKGSATVSGAGVQVFEFGGRGPQGPAGAAGAQGPQGLPGADGAQGAQGIQGPVGPGLPTGGSPEQVARKASATDYDTTWEYPHKIGRGTNALGTGSGVVTFDLNASQHHTHTANGNITLALANVPAAAPWAIVIDATNWGAYTVTLGAGWKRAKGAIAFTAAGTDRVAICGVGNDATKVTIGVAEENIS